MKEVIQTVVIQSDAESVFHFLTNIDSLYKVWHPRDHVFCGVLFRTIDRKGCIFHFLENFGRFPLYLIVKVTKIEQGRYIEYEPIFPLSLFKLGYGYFKIERISASRSKLIAYVQWGWTLPVIGPLFDVIVEKIVMKVLVEQHMKEEGDNLKNYVEANKSKMSVETKHE